MREASACQPCAAAAPCALVAATRRYTSNFGKSSAEVQAVDAALQASSSAAAGSSSPLSHAAATAAPSPRYRRRSSDPQTPRERADFRRDHKYAKYRPLPDAPWRQLKTKTYLDDAERLYGRKETWHTVEDATVREKLVAILQDYLRDTLAAARLEAKDAKKYAFLCSTAATHYRAHVSSAAFGLPEGLQEWAHGILAGRAAEAAEAGREAAAVETETPAEAGIGEASSTDGVAGAPGSAATAAASPPLNKADEEAAAFREERRRRGAAASLAHSAAVADLPETDTRRSPQSAFPFLRQRAVENEATLDPSLVDWTAKYFPEDDASTFAEPPRLRAGMMDGEDGSGGGTKKEGTGPQAGSTGTRRGLGFARGGHSPGTEPSDSPRSRRSASVHARHRLHRTLSEHEDRHRATFDAEGIYFKVRRQGEAEERAPKPQQVRASELEAPGRRPDVIKVPWSVAARAKAHGYASETLRAKERLIRLTRGEDPETIP